MGRLSWNPLQTLRYYSNYPDSKENTRNFENPIKEPIDNHEDIEMEFIADVNAKNSGQKKYSLRSWKCVLQNKGNSNSKSSSNPSHLHSKRPQSDCSQQGSPIFKKLAIEVDNQAGQHLFIGDTLPSPSPT